MTRTIVAISLLLEWYDSLKGKFSVAVSAYHTAFGIIYTDMVQVYRLIKTVVQ